MFGQGAVGVVDGGEEGCGCCVSDGLDVVVDDQDGAANVVSVGVAVDHVRDRLVSDVANGVEELVTDGRGAVDYNHATIRDVELSLIETFCDHVGTSAKLLDVVARSRDFVSFCSCGDREVLRDRNRLWSKICSSLNSMWIHCPEETDCDR